MAELVGGGFDQLFIGTEGGVVMLVGPVPGARV
jgi:hypothetical protein